MSKAADLAFTVQNWRDGRDETQVESIYKNLTLKQGKGTYDSAKAAKLFKYAVESYLSAKYGSVRSMTPAQRLAVGREMVKVFETEYASHGGFLGMVDAWDYEGEHGFKGLVKKHRAGQRSRCVCPPKGRRAAKKTKKPKSYFADMDLRPGDYRPRMRAGVYRRGNDFLFLYGPAFLRRRGNLSVADWYVTYIGALTNQPKAGPSRSQPAGAHGEFKVYEVSQAGYRRVKTLPKSWAAFFARNVDAAEWRKVRKTLTVK